MGFSSDTWMNIWRNTVAYLQELGRSLLFACPLVAWSIKVIFAALAWITFFTWKLHKQVSGRLGSDVRAEEGGCGWTARTGSDPASGQVQGVGTAARTVPAHAKGGEHGQIPLLGLLLDVDVIGRSLDRGGRLQLAVRVQWGRLRPSQVRGAAVPHQGALALRIGGELLLHLDVWAGEVLVAAHVKLQAEVTGGGEGAEFALKSLTPVLVLMYLEEEDRHACQISSRPLCFFRTSRENTWLLIGD